MATRVQNLLFLLVLSTCACFSWAHVALTFPPARKYDLDFLDNSRTPAPCGMPKGKKSFFLLAINKIYELQYLIAGAPSNEEE
ncbi:CLUMA_CG009154, isoform A [Clunio marinus]|uniref:CLUMA_CG009154, isoform A n=1 Tax=Clunio marinus TaxID=568069 RepID=A0A1J1I5Z6_9DIPT|nr:CLUMA_CG009154, isoform A [Clunio marinus]